ncbi:tyrosine-type recombinase/integrase [Ralstonia mannitolilytica]|uniref:Tyrosine recombinase XerC n=1 Tax=Ralstonia mannitolilytica TaxID=105219 RepID=A0AAJ4ZJ97_9RALS|nr:tyrosine-type recombinase/integrase [Ralstonia mannitolilytica]CAG2152075.1 Tyrosine recombinase XerC [Ralstonia mannitolilytica]CAJ0736503.1 Tyrosine recombinase XerC [Ralstonia mannitolilytica]SUD86614.1 Tyrosine recombinase XerC [Ralstonia mannitolilytica]SUD96275.1 Tyrosine recombinase XerC [Ralstonia mannitolilytica]
MRLTSSTSDFTIAGVRRPGFPILLWKDMRSCEPVNEFLRVYLLRGTIESERSWEAIARALYDYFGFLEANGLQWDDVKRGEQKNLVAAYRDYSFKECHLARNTVRQRLVYVCEFYKYAVRKQWVDALPYAYELRRIGKSAEFLAHIDRSGGEVQVPSVMPKKHKTLVRYLTLDQARRLLRAADNPHHHALVNLALRTGLRRLELATFPLSYVVDPDNLGTTEPNVTLHLDPEDGSGMRTKGSTPRDLVVSRNLMRYLHRYAIHYRGERSSLNNEPQLPLLLNQDGKPYAADGKGIGPIVCELGRRADVQAHPHILRHTYATHTLSSLQRARKSSGIEPLIFLKSQLGHKSLRSTEIYLHCSNELAISAIIEYDRELESEAWSMTP